ncbi:MAG: flagellar motor protein MotB [Desulfotignum sp.]|jgi:chemotaxis protein MotB|nr:flagellar motor protein MotB [Desulfotignum sp.]
MRSDTIVSNLRTELEISERKRLRLQRSQFLNAFEPEDTSLWSMLDLMTLILIFFIMLYAVPAPPKNITKTQEQVAKLFSKPVFQNHTQPRKEIRPAHNTASHERDKTQEKPGFSALEKALHLAMTGTSVSDYEIRMTRDRIKLVIGENISFPTGRAELLEHIKGPLTKIADALSREQGFRIVVSGHTDSTPIHTPRYPSNWELSVARALGVAKFLMARDVNPALISVEGFGPYQPVAPNTDPDSRRENRRVEISLIQDDR